MQRLIYSGTSEWSILLSNCANKSFLQVFLELSKYLASFYLIKSFILKNKIFKSIVNMLRSQRIEGQR